MLKLFETGSDIVLYIWVESWRNHSLVVARNQPIHEHPLRKDVSTTLTDLQ